MNNLIQYRPLFSTHLLHEYYLPRDVSLFSGIPPDQRLRIEEHLQNSYNISEYLDINPSMDCEKVLANHGLLFKKIDFGFFVGTKVTSMGDGTFVPYIPLNEPFSLRFLVELEDKHLFNFSNLRLEANIENKDHFVYYFTNRANNAANLDSLYLTQPIPEFEDTFSYESGELVIDNNNPGNPEMLEAIEDNGPAAFDGSHWIRIFSDLDPLPQFVTREDRIALRPAIFKHNVESVAQEVLTFIIFDFNGTQVLTQNFNTSQPGTPLSECELILSDLPHAYYRMEVKDNLGTIIPELELRLYLDDELFIKRPFALIECFHEPDGSLNQYRWLDETNGNRLLSPIYHICLKNRSTFWRYHYADAPTFTATDVEVFEPTPGNPIDSILVSNEPLGLTKFGRNLQIELSGDTVLLPNPDIQSIFPEGGRVYSEINMGGGLGPHT